MGGAVKSITKVVKSVPKAIAKAPKKIIREAAKAPAALTKTALSPMATMATTGAEVLSAVTPAIAQALPVASQAGALYATGGLSGAFSGLGGGGGSNLLSGLGGGKMNFFDNIGDSLGGFAKNLDIGGALNGLLGQNGNSPGSASIPAEALLGQTQKAIDSSNAQTDSKIAGLSKNMMMMIGGGVALIAVILLMKKK